MFRDDEPPLEPCCVEARRARLPALLGDRFHATVFPLMFIDILRIRAPTRLIEVRQTLFGVFETPKSFWGVYDFSRCPACDRELHVLCLDAKMVTAIDQMVRQLYDLIDPTPTDDLVFRQATDDERSRAANILAAIVSGTPLTSPITKMPAPGVAPFAWLTEAMTLAYAFMVVHETSHQGPQRWDVLSYAHYLGAARHAAALLHVTLKDRQAEAWAKELHADQNAFLIMATDIMQSGLRDDRRAHSDRALVAGIALALRSFDLMQRESCYGDPTVYRMLSNTHPPTSFRLIFLSRASQAAQRMRLIEGDRLWADRIVAALDDLHTFAEG